MKAAVEANLTLVYLNAGNANYKPFKNPNGNVKSAIQSSLEH